MQCQLLEAQRQTKEIAQKLEDPQNDERWRRLLGTDPEVEQLQARIQQLEDAIDCKEVPKTTPFMLTPLHTGASNGEDDGAPRDLANDEAIGDFEEPTREGATR